MRYPLGIQDFRRLRTDGYAYVDKTRHIIEMMDAGVALFLSRPRRFGKSLTVSTLAELYGGERGRPLFDGLWAERHWDFAKMERPVIWIKFNDIDTANGFEPALRRELHYLAERLGHTLDIAIKEPSQLLRRLIDKLARTHPSGRCVVLFDEYDKPIVDYPDDVSTAEDNRTSLKRFYSVLKGAGDQLELLFLTGVSAFSKVSIFSDLNHVVNLSFHHYAHTIVGITGAELEANFSNELDATGVPRDTIRQWYNGYSWGGTEDERVYNPWSVFRFLNTRELDNYWFSTGTPTWLVRLMRDCGQFDPKGTVAGKLELTGFRIDDIDTTAALFQTGYLTVASALPGADYVLDYPNREVRQSLERMLLASYLEVHDRETRVPVNTIAEAFRQNDLATVFTELGALLAGVPYDLWQRGDEGIFHAITHLTFSLIGLQVRSEVHTSRGRCDAVVETETHVYALEFKRDRPVAEALTQVYERGYMEAYAASAKTRVAVGVIFAAAARGISGWGAEEMD